MTWTKELMSLDDDPDPKKTFHLGAFIPPSSHREISALELFVKNMNFVWNKMCCPMWLAPNIIKYVVFTFCPQKNLFYGLGLFLSISVEE